MNGALTSATWSRVVRSPEEARNAIAEPGSAYDLRAPFALDDDWAALGFTELAAGELVRPLAVTLGSADHTRALGATLAAGLRPGDLVVLTGALGAGKTVLAQGIGAGLEVRGPVTSPTFVLARRHPGAVPLLHVDVYRLRDGGAAMDLDDLGLDDELSVGVTLVEWGEGVVEALAESRLHVVLGRPDPGPGGADTRTARVIAVGPRWAIFPLDGDHDGIPKPPPTRQLHA